MINEKQQELLKYLSNENRIVTSIELANALNISTRSIKNYVSQLNTLFESKIIISSRNGYLLSNHSLIPSLLAQTNQQIPQSNEDRSFYIIKQLIFHSSTELHLFDLCESLCISYSTLKSLLTKMNTMYKTYNVKFTSNNDCLQIIGDEKDKRKLIRYVISEESGNSFTDITQIKHCFPDFDTDALYSIIKDVFKNHNYYLNDFALSNLLFHLVIMITRKYQGNPLRSNEYLLPTITEQEQNLLDDLYLSIEKKFDIQLNPYELAELSILFRANANYSLSTTKQEVTELIGTEILSLTNRYVQDINTMYMIDLSSEDFTIPFSLHIKGLLFRSRNQLFTNNPMADYIKLNSPIIFDMAIYISLDLMESYEVIINEDETAFIAMHIGAEIERQNKNKSKIPVILLCPDYHSLRTNLLNTLLLDFGNQINIVHSIQSEEALQSLKSEVSECRHYMIISTIPVTRIKSDTIVHISPFNLHEQYDLIQEAILKNQNNYKNQKLREHFDEFFESDLFVAKSSMKNKNQVLSLLCRRLEEKGYVDPAFEKQVYRREEAAGTAFQNIAIPHSVQMDAIKTSIAVTISKTGIRWGKHTVYLVLLIAINKADKQTFRELYESLIALFNDQPTIQEVRNCQSFEDFKKLIYSRIDVYK